MNGEAADLTVSETSARNVNKLDKYDNSPNRSANNIKM